MSHSAPAQPAHVGNLHTASSKAIATDAVLTACTKALGLPCANMSNTCPKASVHRPKEPPVWPTPTSVKCLRQHGRLPLFMSI
eukprot:scaffold84108_cov27-Tisochrysis_lutea.AAC.2